MSELKQDLVRTLVSPDLPSDYVLNSIFEIEKALLVLGRISDQISYFKELKQYRIESLDEEIRKFEDRNNCIRRVILETMKQLKPNEKTFRFPSIGKVSRRVAKDSWQIDDKDKLVQFLEGKGLKDRAVQTKEVVNVREIKKVVEEISQFEDVPGVSRVKGTESISVTYETSKGDAAAKHAKDVDLELLDSLTAEDL